MKMEPHWMIKVKGQSRECRYENDRYIHVLNSTWSISELDPEIEEIKFCGVKTKET